MSCINGMASFFSPNYLLQVQLPHEAEHRQLPAPAMPPCHNLQDLTGERYFLLQILTQSLAINLAAAAVPSLSPVLGKRSVSLSGIGNASDDVHGVTKKAEDELSDDVMQAGEKKRRLNTEQVRALERSFELQGNKLESERKLQLAAALGLHPRQVAIWFQNRRARWKTKQLEMDYDLLKTQFDAFKSQNEALKQHNKKLQSEIFALKGRETTPEVINLNKETEGSCSNIRSENSSDIKTTSANLVQFQSTRPAEIEQYCDKNVENIVEDGSFSNLLCSMGDHYQVPFWSWSEHLHFH